MSIGVLLVLGMAALAAGVVLGRGMARTWLALAVTGSGFLLAAAVAELAGAPEWQWRSAFRVGGEPLHLRLDPLSAIFMALLGVVGALGAIYAREYWSDRHAGGSAPRGRLWWCAMELSMGLVLLCSNGLHFLIAWELFAISGYFLITLDGVRREAREAGWLYLACSHAGTLCLFAFFALLAGRTGSWDLGPMRGQAGLAPLFWLALCGFGVKAGLFPLHIWLPSAHANAPSHVSALMSGVAIKMGIYGLVRFGGWLPLPPAAGWATMGVAMLTALFGIAFAFVQNDLKRLLAYCSVENVGVIAIGIGGAFLGLAHGDALWGRLLLAGALFHVWNHGVVKSLLFLGAGSVLCATGTRDISRLGGLWGPMPWTAAVFGLGAAAISGLPPLNGFVSEWLVFLGLFDAAAGRGPPAWAAGPAAIVLAAAGALALAAFIKATAAIFLGAPRTQAAGGAREGGPLMRGPMLALAAAAVAMGLAPFALWPAISRAVGAWNPRWGDPAAPAPLLALGASNLALAALFAAAGAWLWRKTRSNGVRRAPTWDCGYSIPTARMQYTAGSFSAIVAGWFSWLLQPVKTQRRQRGPFPAESMRMERIPEAALERVFEPAGAFVLRMSAATRKLQHGRLPFYIAYLVGGLAALAILVLIQ